MRHLDIPGQHAISPTPFNPLQPPPTHPGPPPRQRALEWAPRDFKRPKSAFWGPQPYLYAYMGPPRFRAERSLGQNADGPGLAGVREGPLIGEIGANPRPRAEIGEIGLFEGRGSGDPRPKSIFGVSLLPSQTPPLLPLPRHRLPLGPSSPPYARSPKHAEFDPLKKRLTDQ